MNSSPVRIRDGVAPRLRATRSFALALGLLFGVSGCAATPERKPEAGDPFEPLNRGVYAFNHTIDRNALRPVAVAYDRYTPGWLRKGIGNFFTNLAYPITIGNQVLQGKFALAASDTGRFAVNTLFGLGGVLDLASWDEIPMHDEDLGQTLGYWGLPPGPFLMLPLIGPSSLRDAPSRIADNFLVPFYWYNSGNERWISLIVDTVDSRAELLPLDATLGRTYDPYSFIRDAYLQRRAYRVHDGAVEEDVIADPLEVLDEPAQEPVPGPTPDPTP